MRLLSRYIYVVLNTVIGLVAFGRNLIFLRVFGAADVGQIALMQTIVMLVGFTQAGLINGAFILWATGDRKLNAEMANVLFAGKFALVVLGALVLLTLGPGVLAPALAAETLMIGFAAGVATLGANWMNNALVADQRLKQSSLINAAAISVSMATGLLTLHLADLRLALLAIMLQPLIVAIGSLATNKGARPSSLRPRIEVIKKMLSVGLRPYLGSLSILALFQVERWSIVAVLGTEALGRYFIVLLYLSFFTLVPVALMNISFPRATQALNVGDDQLFRQIRQRHAIELAAYSGLALILKVALLHSILTLLLPQYAGEEPLIYIAFLAGVIVVIQDTSVLVLYSIARTGPILVGGVLSLGVFALGLAALWSSGSFSLQSVLYARIVAGICGLMYLQTATFLIVRNRARKVPSQ